MMGPYRALLKTKEVHPKITQKKTAQKLPIQSLKLRLGTLLQETQQTQRGLM